MPTMELYSGWCIRDGERGNDAKVLRDLRHSHGAWGEFPKITCTGNVRSTGEQLSQLTIKIHEHHMDHATNHCPREPFLPSKLPLVKPEQ